MTLASLILDGNLPSEIDRLAKFEITSEQTEEQDSSNEVGMTSIGEGIGDDSVRRLITSKGVRM